MIIVMFVRYCGVYVAFVGQFLVRFCSRCCPAWCYRGWTMETQNLPGSQFTFWNVCSQW